MNDNQWISGLLIGVSKENLSVKEKAKYLLYTSLILLLLNFFRSLFFLIQQEWLIFFSGFTAVLCLVLSIWFLYRGKTEMASNLTILSVVVNLVFNAINSSLNIAVFEIFNYPYIESAFIYLTGLIFVGFLSFRIYQPILFAIISITLISFEYYKIHLAPDALFFNEQSRITYVEYFIVFATAGFGAWLALRINKRLTDLLEREASKVKQANEMLEIQVQERTSELEEKTIMLEEQNELLNEEINERKKVQEELILAKEKAEEASKAKEQFLSTMSHELRTPLNAVIGMAHLLESEDLNPEQKDYVETLGFSANQLLALINDVLDFSKIESAKMEFDYAPNNLVELIQNLVDSFQFTAQQKGIKLVFTWDDNIPPYLISDGQKLNQIFTNLINNAIKFTEEGHVWVRAKVIRDIKSKVMLAIEIEDSGIGIAPENHEKVFEHFSQASSGTTTKYGGTGLGLAITKKLVELMGGSIKLESELDKGSTFTVVLALEPSDVANEEPADMELSTESIEGTRILLVEDNLINQKVALKIMSRWDVLVDIANDGYEALEAFENSPYDIILMDIQMPNMDGYETTRKIRQTEKDTGRHRTPIIALTASAFINVKNKSKEMGMDDHVSKPFKPAVLKQKILSLISEKARSG